MAKITVNKSVQPTKIEKFLGLNISNTGDTQIKLGESGNMENFYVTSDYKLRKIYGYQCFYQFETPIKGMYTVKFGNVEYLLVATGGKLYYFLKEEIDDEENWNNVQAYEIGSIPNSDASFFTFDNKVYILCNGYYSWDGTTFKEVEGYIPLVFINTPPTGGGIVYDEINMLTGKKHQTFNGNGTATEFFIAQKNVESIDKVYVDGVLKTVTTDYTVDLTNGKVTFITAPQQAMDNVDIYWTLDDGDRKIIERMKFGTIFGGDIDIRVFLYGYSSMKNRVYFSGITDGIPSVEYFPATAQIDIGPSNFAVTDLTRQYDRLLVTTNKPEAYYLTIATESLSVILTSGETTSRLVPSVGIYPLNESHGNVAMGQGQLINNYPVTIDKNSIIQWKATNVRDEKNMEDIAEKIKLDLQNMSLNLIKTLDYQSQNQLWLGENNKIYIYDYLNKTYSRLKIAHDLSFLVDMGNVIYMATDDGRIVRWGEEFDSFDGSPIIAHWEMNFSDFGVPYLRKTMSKLWVLLQPQALSSAKISFISNRSQSQVSKYINYKLQILDNVDFSDFSFQISNNPQPFRLKLKAKKFTNLKITINNDEATDCTILALVLKVESFGESK